MRSLDSLLCHYNLHSTDLSSAVLLITPQMLIFRRLLEGPLQQILLCAALPSAPAAMSVTANQQPKCNCSCGTLGASHPLTSRHRFEQIFHLTQLYIKPRLALSKAFDKRCQAHLLSNATSLTFLSPLTGSAHEHTRTDTIHCKQGPSLFTLIQQWSKCSLPTHCQSRDMVWFILSGVKSWSQLVIAVCRCQKK